MLDGIRGSLHNEGTAHPVRLMRVAPVVTPLEPSPIVHRMALLSDTVLWLLLGALALLAAVGGYLIRHFRDHGRNPTSEDHDLMTNFREMHARGELSDEEYRTIKSKLSSKLRSVITNADKKA
jgi:hypothetical protein